MVEKKFLRPSITQKVAEQFLKNFLRSPLIFVRHQSIFPAIQNFFKSIQQMFISKTFAINLTYTYIQ